MAADRVATTTQCLAEIILTKLHPSDDIGRDRFRTQSHMEIVRKNYCDTLQQNGSYYDEFKKIATELKKNLTCELHDVESQILPQYIYITYEDNISKYDSRTTNVIFVGRLHGCDIQLNNNKFYCSRVSGIIIVDYRKGKLFIVDVGSLFGIKTKIRAKGKDCQHSVPYDRNVLMFDLGEQVVLQMGDAELALSPEEWKVCVVCYERPRNITFPCKHYCCCAECSLHLQVCPICRTPTNHQEKMHFAISTMNVS